MYKDCFKLMDINKDGTIDKNDLRGAFDNVGVLMTEGELDGLLGEINGACTYQNMVNMFQEKMPETATTPTTCSASSTLMRTTWSRPRRSSDSLSPRRRRRRRKPPHSPSRRLPLQRRTRASPRRRRRRRRPPSKCCYDHPHYSQTKACELRTSAMVPYVAILSPGNFIKSKINMFTN